VTIQPELDPFQVRHIEVGDEVVTPTGHTGIVQSYQESHSVLYWGKDQKPTTKHMRYCQVRLTDLDGYVPTPLTNGSGIACVTDMRGKLQSVIEWHGQEYLTLITMSEYEQACILLGEDYFA